MLKTFLYHLKNILNMKKLLLWLCILFLTSNLVFALHFKLNSTKLDAELEILSRLTSPEDKYEIARMSDVIIEIYDIQNDTLIVKGMAWGKLFKYQEPIENITELLEHMKKHQPEEYEIAVKRFNRIKELLRKPLILVLIELNSTLNPNRDIKDFYQGKWLRYNLIPLSLFPGDTYLSAYVDICKLKELELEPEVIGIIGSQPRVYPEGIKNEEETFNAEELEAEIKKYLLCPQESYVNHTHLAGIAFFVIGIIGAILNRKKKRWLILSIGLILVGIILILINLVL